MTTWTALRDGFNAFTERLPLLLGAWVVILGCQQLISLAIPASYPWIEPVVTALVLAPLYAGQHLLALQAVRREPASLKDLFAGLPKWGVILGTYVLVGLLTALGFIALIIPGILVSLMYSFVFIRFLDPHEGARKVGPGEAMAESVSYTRGYRGTILGIGLLLCIPYLVFFVLLSISNANPSVPPWIVEVAAIFCGTLFLGPVQATSLMVVYNHALEHPHA